MTKLILPPSLSALSLSGISRRSLLKGAAAGAGAVAAGTLFAPAIARAQTAIKIGYVSPQSGPLAAFSEADAFVTGEMTKLAADAGLPIEIVVRDSQSDPNRAGEVARELIVDEGVALLVAASTPETTNPVSTVAEIEEFPCITTMAPWQPWYIGRQGNPGDPASWAPFDYTYHYFWGLEDIIAVFAGMWGQLDTNKKVGGLFPNDADGNAWGDPNVGIAPGLAQAGGFTRRRSGPLREPAGRFLGADQRVQGRASRDRHRRRDPAGLHDVLDPGEPAGVQAEGGDGREGDPVPVVGRGARAARAQPLAPKSGGRRTIRSSRRSTARPDSDVAAAFTAASSRPWTQPIGFIYSLFEVAIDVLKRAGCDRAGCGRRGDQGDRASIRSPARCSGVPTPALGPISANVCKTPLVGGQWRRNDDNTFDLVVVDNSHAPEIPAGGTMEALPRRNAARACRRIEALWRRRCGRGGFPLGRRGRGPRHHRGQRRRQIEPLQPGHRRAAARRRHGPSRGPRHHARSRCASAARPGSAGAFRSRGRSRASRCSRTCWSRRSSAATRAAASQYCGEVLERTGLGAKANVVAGKLTLLDRKRLELARALATRPQLLLLDEIAGGLTEAECHELVALIQALNARGHDDRLDRAHRACAALGGDAADGARVRQEDRRWASRAR